MVYVDNNIRSMSKNDFINKATESNSKTVKTEKIINY